MLTPEKKQKIEDQIELQQKAISYDMKEFTIELYVNKYLKDIDKEDNELYVPDYQREFIWDDRHQSRFIESLYLGLPVPFMFSAEIKESGRLAIVDVLNESELWLHSYLTNLLYLIWRNFQK